MSTIYIPINLQPLFNLTHKTQKDKNSAEGTKGPITTGWGVHWLVGDISIWQAKNQANAYPSIKWVKATRKLSETYLIKYNIYS